MDVLACPACSVLGCGSLVAPAQQLQQLQQPLAKPIPQAHSVQLAEGTGGSPGGSQGLPSLQGAFHLLLCRCWLWLVSDMHQLQSNSTEPLANPALEQLS